MRYAIVQSGGKQYKAVEGETIDVDRLDTEIGKKVELGEVLLVSDGEQVHIGTPTLGDVKIAATVVSQDKGPKIIVFKYKPKIRYRVKTGHRQQMTRLLIDSISIKGESRSAKAEEATSEKAAAKPRKKAAAAKKAPAAKKPAAKKPAASKAKAPAAKPKAKKAK
jgi:large subunit ribosomal protein L21